MAGIVLDKCITREEKDKNGTPYTTHILYNYEFVDDFDEPQLGRVGNFLLKKVLHYKSQKKDIPLVITNPLSENGNLFSSTESIASAKQSSTLSSARKISAIPPAKNWGPKVYKKDNHTLSLMVRVSYHYMLQSTLNYKYVYSFSIEGGTKKNQITTTSIGY